MKRDILDMNHPPFPASSS